MLAEEVNDTLQEKGHVTIPELTKLYDLPADFLTKVCSILNKCTNLFNELMMSEAI